jgi:hypothetical protein
MVECDLFKLYDSYVSNAFGTMSKFVLSRETISVVAAMIVTASLASCGSSSERFSVQSLHRSIAPDAVMDRHPGALARMYPALEQIGPSGISVVTLARARLVTSSPARPIWVSVTPENPNATLPEIASARILKREGQRRIWLSRSNHGGLCLLVFDPARSPHPATDHTITASCSNASEVEHGVALAQRLGVRLPQEVWSIVGAVPSGVTKVSLALLDGSVRYVPVSDNSYATVVDEQIKEVSFVRNGVRQHINI